MSEGEPKENRVTRARRRAHRTQDERLLQASFTQTDPWRVLRIMG